MYNWQRKNGQTLFTNQQTIINSIFTRKGDGRSTYSVLIISMIFLKLLGFMGGQRSISAPCRSVPVHFYSDSSNFVVLFGSCGQDLVEQDPSERSIVHAAASK